jgi:hypothetical protein
MERNGDRDRDKEGIGTWTRTEGRDRDMDRDRDRDRDRGHLMGIRPWGTTFEFEYLCEFETKSDKIYGMTQGSIWG